MRILCLTLFLASSFALIAPADSNGPIAVQNYKAPIRVACVGDSITMGAGTSNKVTLSYPAQLGRMFDAKWDVRNFGVSGRTLLNAGDHPYQKEAAFKQALAFNPDVVIIMLGTNDTKPQNWKFKDQFIPDYKDLVNKFKALSSSPRIFVCLPVPVIGIGNYHINEAGVEEQMPEIQTFAEAEGLGLIDMHAALSGHDSNFPDRVHPNDSGANLMAKAAYKTLTGEDFTGTLAPVPAPVAPAVTPATPAPAH